MFWDQAASYKEEVRKKEYKLTYSILETDNEQIYKKTWHKLDPTFSLWRLIISDENTKGSHWDIVKENDGKSFIWVTDKYLTLLEIKGACFDRQ